MAQTVRLSRGPMTVMRPPEDGSRARVNRRFAPMVNSHPKESLDERDCKTKSIPSTILPTQLIDGAFVESQAARSWKFIQPDIAGPSEAAAVPMADEETTRRAIAAARRDFATYGAVDEGKNRREISYAGCMRRLAPRQ